MMDLTNLNPGPNVPHGDHLTWHMQQGQGKAPFLRRTHRAHGLMDHVTDVVGNDFLTKKSPDGAEIRLEFSRRVTYIYH